VEVASGDTAVSPWGLSSSPHINITTQQRNPSLSIDSWENYGRLTISAKIRNLLKSAYLRLWKT